MANYIKSEVLAEAYTHLEIDLFEDKVKLEALRVGLAKFFGERASFMFGTDVDIKIEFEEGSLKTKIIAIGSAAATLATVIGQYGDFRQSVTQLANDAVGLAQAANMEVIFRTQTPHCDRLRIEKRKGVFGRVASLLSELDSISTKVAESRFPTNHLRLKDANAAVDTLLTWDGAVDTLFSKFDGFETEACVAEGLLVEVKKLPRQFPWQSELTQSSIKTSIVESDANFAGQVAGASARYSASLKSIEKKLKDILTQSVAQRGG